MRLVLALLSLLLLLSAARAEDDVDADVAAGRRKLPGLSLTLHLEAREYVLGEPIPVTMRTTYEGDRKLAVWHVTYDRCGRIQDLGFTAVGADGTPVRDPIADWLGGIMGGVRTYGPLEPGKPFEQQVILNEWLVFDSPGRYRITGWSRLVEFDQTGDGRCDGPVIPLQSEPVELVLVAPQGSGREAQLAAAKSRLEAGSNRERDDTMRDLRFLVDPRALPLLVEGLFDPFGNVQNHAFFGLLAFPDLEPVREAILTRATRSTFKAADIGTFTSILTAADLRAAGVEGGWDSKAWTKARHESEAKWREVFRGTLRSRIEELTGAEKARALVNAMAMGPVVPRDDPEIWKIVLAHVADLGDETGRAAGFIEDYLRIEAYLPDLRRMAGDEALHPVLRNASVIALFAMGDESFSDRLLEDLALPQPVFDHRAHRLVADARAEEAAARLLDAYVTHEDARESIARRIHDLDAPLPTEPLVGLVRAARGRRSNGGDWLLKTLAKRAPEEAFPFVRESLETPGFLDFQGHRTALEVLAGLDLPMAEDCRRRVLLTSEPEDRERLALALRGVATAAAHVPDLLLLAKGDPTGAVRAAAEYVLVDVTGLPERGIHGKTRKERETIAALWEQWWEENGARFGRWGRVRHGIALRVSATKGVFSLGEAIPLTVRMRREAGDVTLHPEILIVVKRGGNPETLPLPVPEGGPVLPGEPHTEVAYTVDLSTIEGLREPGAYRIHVLATPGGDEPESQDARMLVVAAPLRIRLR